MSTRVPINVLAAVDDLFFSTKIETTARQIGAKLTIVRDARELGEYLEEALPNLIIIDLNSRTCAPIESIRRIKADSRLAGIPVIGFFSHVQVELERDAREAGCDRILARSAFSRKLPDILLRVNR